MPIGNDIEYESKFVTLPIVTVKERSNLDRIGPWMLRNARDKPVPETQANVFLRERRPSLKDFLVQVDKECAYINKLALLPDSPADLNDQVHDLLQKQTHRSAGAILRGFRGRQPSDPDVASSNQFRARLVLGATVVFTVVNALCLGGLIYWLSCVELPEADTMRGRRLNLQMTAINIAMVVLDAMLIVFVLLTAAAGTVRVARQETNCC